MTEPAKPKARRGFAAMDPEKRRKIAQKGGSAVPGHKRSFFKNRALATEAGSKGGMTSGRGRRKRPPA